MGDYLLYICTRLAKSFNGGKLVLDDVVLDFWKMGCKVLTPPTKRMSEVYNILGTSNLSNRKRSKIDLNSS